MNYNNRMYLQKDFFYYRKHEGQEQNNQKGYIKFGYLYFKEVMEKIKLPLTEEEVAFLYRKLKKRHAISLTRFLLRTRDWKTFKQLSKDTDFKFNDILSGYFK